MKPQAGQIGWGKGQKYDYVRVRVGNMILPNRMCFSLSEHLVHNICTIDSMHYEFSYSYVFLKSIRRKFNCRISSSTRTKSIVHSEIDGPNSLVIPKLELFESVNYTFNSWGRLKGAFLFCPLPFPPDSSYRVQ